jgi:hypothetical protein
MLPFLLFGFVAGIAWGITRAGPGAWLGSIAALIAFGYNPTDPLSPLFAFAAVFVGWRLIKRL